MNTDDILWKGIIEDLFDDFLRFFYAGADHVFDMGRGFEFLDKELAEVIHQPKTGAAKFVDKLVKVFTKEDNEEWVLVHIEVQGYQDKEFPARMFTYFYRIREKYKKNVASIVLLTDGNKKYHPRQYVYEYLGTKLTYSFKTYKIQDQDDGQLKASSNPFAIVIAAAKLALMRQKLGDEKLYISKIELARRLLAKKISKQKINGLFYFLKSYINFAEPEFDENLKQKRRLLTVKTITPWEL